MSTFYTEPNTNTAGQLEKKRVRFEEPCSSQDQAGNDTLNQLSRLRESPSVHKPDSEMLRQIVQAVHAALKSATVGNAAAANLLPGSFCSLALDTSLGSFEGVQPYKVSQVKFNPIGCVFNTILHILPINAHEGFEFPISVTCCISENKEYWIEISVRERIALMINAEEISSAVRWVQRKIMRKIKRGIDYGSVDVLISLLRNIDNVKGHDVVLSKAKEPQSRCSMKGLAKILMLASLTSLNASKQCSSQDKPTHHRTRYQPVNRIKAATRIKMAKAA